MLFARPSLAYSAFESRSPPSFALQLLNPKPGVVSTNEIDASHHMAAVMELDLTACHPNSLVDRLNAMPALKTSAGKKAFFLFVPFSSPFFFFPAATILSRGLSARSRPI